MSFQKGQITLLPIIKDFSFEFIIKKSNENSDYFSLEIKISEVSLSLALTDIKRIQMILEYFKKYIYYLIDQMKIYFHSEKIKFNYKISEYDIEIHLIAINFRENNRESSLIIVKIDSVRHNLKEINENQTFLVFALNIKLSISNKNLSNGNIEDFIPQTNIKLGFAIDSNITFGFSIEELNINFNPSFAKIIMMLIYKFNNNMFSDDTEHFLQYKSKYYFINNLDETIRIHYTQNQTINNYSIENYNFRKITFPLVNFNDNTTISFEYIDIEYSFTPSNDAIPKCFENLSISIDYEKDAKTIIVNPKFSFHNKLDFMIYIYKYHNDKLYLYCELNPNCSFTFRKDIYFFSDCCTDISDINHKIFDFSIPNSPNIIQIYKGKIKKYISFHINVKKKDATNAQIYEIIPSFVFKNLIPLPIVFNFYDKNQSIDSISFQVLEKRQMNIFNHDTTSFDINSSLFNEHLVFDVTDNNKIFSNSNDISIKVEHSKNNNKKKIIIYTPCILFNKTNEIIYYSHSYRNESDDMKRLLVNDCKFLGLDEGVKHSLKIDIIINGYRKVEEIDCLINYSYCQTILLPKLDNSKLFYPLNFTISSGDYPMDNTHVVTFTDHLFVINNLPFDFSLCPITSTTINENIVNNELYTNSQDSILISHRKENNQNCQAIKCFPKNGYFIFSASDYSNHPIVKLDDVSRKIFRMKKDDETFIIELNIYEEKSSFYACFQIPTLPYPLIINNSLKTPILVYQKIENKTIIKIDPDSSFFYIFDEPFINNTMLYFEIDENDEDNDDDETEQNYESFLFSFEDQFAPFESNDLNFKIITLPINRYSNMIHVFYRNNKLIYENKYNINLSINLINISMINNELTNFKFNDIIAKSTKDDTNTYTEFIISSILIDDQNINRSSSNIFFKCSLISPRGIPFLSIINYMNIQIQPIIFHIDILSSLNNTSLFLNDIQSDKLRYIDNKNLIQPTFHSININKTIISYFEISPIDIFIFRPNTDDTNYSTIHYYVNKIKEYFFSESNQVLIPKFFAYHFCTDKFFLLYTLLSFYGFEFSQQLPNNICIKLINRITFPYEKYNLVELDSIQSSENNDSCSNRIFILNNFNKIELINILQTTSNYFRETSDFIEQLVNEDPNAIYILKDRFNDKFSFFAGIKK